MKYEELPPEFGKWLGSREEAIAIFVSPVEGSGALVDIVSDPEQVKAAYKAYQDVFIDQAVKRYLEKEKANV